jgi:predicted nucleic-acid-binding protein
MKKLFSRNAVERNEEAIRMLDSGELESGEIIEAIINAVLCDGEKAEIGTLVWALLESKKWDGEEGKGVINTLAVCGNYEVRHHCMQLSGWL